jgi:dihydrofolate reductase
MRKIIVSINITLDGFIAGLDGELDWHFDYWDEEMAKFASEQLADADTILLGSVTYKAMSRFWPSKAMDLSYPREDIAFADMMNGYEKIVFSKSLKDVEWNNSRLVRRGIGREILKLKQKTGKNIIIYGSESIVSALHRLGLIDELALWVHPVFLKKGKALFENEQEKLEFKLLNTKAFSSGVMILNYGTIKEADQPGTWLFRYKQHSNNHH